LLQKIRATRLKELQKLLQDPAASGEKIVEIEHLVAVEKLETDVEKRRKEELQQEMKKDLRSVNEMHQKSHELNAGRACRRAAPPSRRRSRPGGPWSRSRRWLARS